MAKLPVYGFRVVLARQRYIGFNAPSTLLPLLERAKLGQLTAQAERYYLVVGDGLDFELVYSYLYQQLTNRGSVLD